MEAQKESFKEPKTVKDLSSILSRSRHQSKLKEENLTTFSEKSKISHDLSKINYLKTSSTFEKDFDIGSAEVDALTESDDNCSHVLYDTIADKFYGVPNFERDLHWANVHLAEHWGSHAYEYSAWEDDEKFVVKQKQYQDLELTEEERDGLLTERIIAVCSSYFTRSPETEEYVLCKCVLMNKSLNDITALKKYHYIQYLDISKNSISSLAALDQLPFLMYLDASYNMLTEILNFKAPLNLMFVNLSFNDIKYMSDLSDFWSLIVLDLAHNEIEMISGVQNLRYLRGLNLSYNWISKFEGLNKLERLQCLNLYNNVIGKFETGPDVGLKTMFRLKKVTLARNLIHSLEIVEGARFIRFLDISDNKIEDMKELVYLDELVNLNELDMRDNPIRYNARYHNTCVSYCKHLFVLDGEEVTAETKVLSRKKFKGSIFEYIRPQSQHMLLSNINFPYITKSVVPYNHPPDPIIVLVGPPSCLKGFLIDLACEIFPKYITRGVNHTTRPRSEGEIDGEQYHFISYETFKDMMRTGLFYTTAEYFGHLYGFAHTEMAKVKDKKSVLIIHSDLNGALMLRARGLRPNLVLTLPRSEEMHRKYLKRKYFCHSLMTGILEIGMSTTKVYEGLARTKTFSQRQMMEMVKKILDDLFHREQQENKSGTEIDPNIYMSGGLTLRELVEGTTEPGKDNPSKKDTDEYWCFLMDENTDDQILCLSGLDEKQIESLKKVGVDQVIKSYMELNMKEELMTDLEDHKQISRMEIRPDIWNKKKESEKMSEGGEEPIHISRMDIRQGILNEEEENGESLEDKEEERSSLTIKEVSILQKLYEDVIESRKTYLDMHRNNPGLFTQVLFSDDLNQGLDVLTEVLKSCVQTHHLRLPVCTLKHNPNKHPLVLNRLENLKRMMLPEGLIENERKNCAFD